MGIKDSSGDLAFMMRMIAAVRPMRPDFAFLTGWEAVLVPMLLVGCDGGTNATSGVVPELTRKLYDLTLAGQIDEAMRLQYRLLELFDAMLYSADFPEGFRAAVELRGFDGPQPAAAERPAADRPALQTCCSASWPISATSRRPRRLPAADRPDRAGPHQPDRGQRDRDLAPARRHLNAANAGAQRAAHQVVYRGVKVLSRRTCPNSCSTTVNRSIRSTARGSMACNCGEKLGLAPSPTAKPT